MNFTKNYSKTALIHNDKDISYEELINSIRKFSSLLNITKGDRVVILSENRPEWGCAFFSVWNKRGIAVPVDFMSGSDEIAYIINDCKPTTIFTSTNNLPVIKIALKEVDYNPALIIFEELMLDDNGDEEKLFPDDKDDIAVIIYTSGTTGNPKGVMLSYENLYSNVECITGLDVIGFKDRVIAILPFHHSFPLQGSMLMPLFIGGTVVFLSQLSSEEIIKTMQRHKVTMIIGVPRLYKLFHDSIMKKINANKVAKLLFGVAKRINNISLNRKLFKKVQDTFGGNMKYFICGGAKLDETIAQDFWTLGFKTLEGYGMTEASPLISFNPPERVKIGSVGKVFEGAKCKIVDDEIVVTGRNIMKGYYNKEEDTNDILKDGWIYTGDLGYVDKDDYLYITGRKKEIIVLPNGKNLNPEEIESKIITNYPYVKEIGVIQKEGQLLAIIYPDFALLEKDQIVSIQETIKWNVIDKYNRSSSSYKKIFNFTIVHNELPKTRLGKLKRFTLMQLLQKEKKEKSAVEVPDYQEYKLLEEYLESVVKKDILPEEHVELDLGLDSLDRVELQAHIEKMFGISMTDEDLSHHSTVEKLALFIKEKKTKIENEVMHWGKMLKQEIKYDIPNKNYVLKSLKLFSKPFFRFYMKVETEGLENIPDSPVIMVPNHQSFFDGLMIANILKNRMLNRTYFFANEKNIKSKISQYVARNSNILVMNINKNLKLTLQKIAAILNDGNNMVIFPEGNRSRDGKLTAFKKTFAIISKELNIPVIPVVIKGAYEKFSVESKFPKPGKIQLKFLKPIYPADLDYDAITMLTQNNIQSYFPE
ncbi:MAG: AMP-binding protein [Ignavibacteriales bacterium]|nr:AMP-binding protein [Ignavibacteriales bacterium]